MPNRPIRRSQLIAPFGPGAIVVAPDGSMSMVAGLDRWLPPHPEEFVIPEWRLQAELHIDQFYAPADFRRLQGGQQQVANAYHYIPALRFPQWHLCPKCNTLGEYPATEAETPRCNACAQPSPRSSPSTRRGMPMQQVRVIALCEDGHAQDFPWREWVHESLQPTCDKPLKLNARAAGLASMWVECGCRARRNLARIDQFSMRPLHQDGDEPGELNEPQVASDQDLPTARDTAAPAPLRHTELTRHLTPDQLYTCAGRRPWLDDDIGAGCGKHLLGALVGASNNYFARVRSAIYLPANMNQDQLVEMMEQQPFARMLARYRRRNETPSIAELREDFNHHLAPYADRDIEQALKVLAERAGGQRQRPQRTTTDDFDTVLRREEYDLLSRDNGHDTLRTKTVPITRYPGLVELFAGITLVPRLRETRVFTGFSRIQAESEHLSDEDHFAMLWRTPPERGKRWLPATVVHGEGIFVRLDEAKLQTWERRPEVTARLGQLDQRMREVRAQRHLSDREQAPARRVLLHTLAHLLINQLVYSCGYSSASLRERLYASTNPTAPMAGVLVYTAAGDSEGTMGGLVRMGRPEHLEPVLAEALTDAQWCSADPVCMELGEQGGQGPNSCNLAACHNCALIPETSCEHYNMMLDRWTLVGSHEDPSLGFFAPLVINHARSNG